MALDTSAIIAGQVIQPAHITQLVNLLTGVMEDQPITVKNRLTLTRTAAATPSTLTYLQVTGIADTSVNAEANDVYFNLARTLQFLAGSVPTTQRGVRVEAPTYSATSASTITNAATLYVGGPPAAGSNMTLTNTYSLWVAAGVARLDGGAIVAGSAGFKVNAGDAILANSGSALATGATTGFTHISNSAGRPTGTPAALVTGATPLHYDSTNDRLWAWSSTDSKWKLIGGKEPCVEVRKNTTQSSGSGTEVFVSFGASDVEVTDTDGFHDPNTNATRFTVPTGLDGRYYYTATATWTSAAVGAVRLAIYKNSAGTSTVANLIGKNTTNVPGYVPDVFTIDGYADLAAGDYIEFAATQTGGGATTLTTEGTYATGFKMIRVSAR